MTKYTKIATAFFLFSIPAFSASDSDRINNQMTGSVAKVSSGGELLEKQDTSGVYNYHEVTYEHIKQFQASSSSPQNGSKIQFGEGIEEKNARLIAEKLAIASKQKTEAEAKKVAPTWPKFVEGYCYTKNEVDVEKIATYAYLTCDFADRGGRGDLVVSLVPDFYANALIAKPLYITMVNEKTGKKQRIPIESGAVLTKDRLSINVANVVNDRKIERLTASGAYTTLNVATKQMQAYMADEKESRTTQSTETNNGLGYAQTIQTTNRVKPQSSDYLVAAGVEIVSELAKVIGTAFVENLPYTFKMYKDSVLYVDMELADKVGIRGYDPVVPGVIKKQPKYDLATGKEEDMDVTSIPIKEKVQNQSVTQMR